MLEVRAAFLDNLKFMSWGFGDLNNDKIVDYCRVFTQGGQDEFKTVLEIYLAVGQAGFSQRPSKRIVLDQYCVGLVVTDLDGDGVGLGGCGDCHGQFDQSGEIAVSETYAG